MRIELIRAWPSRYETTTAHLPEGACVGDACRATGWALDAEFTGVAVFGQAATMATPLHDGDRVEFLRSLQIDPKQARRLRAERAKGAGKPV